MSKSKKNEPIKPIQYLLRLGFSSISLFQAHNYYEVASSLAVAGQSNPLYFLATAVLLTLLSAFVAGVVQARDIKDVAKIMRNILSSEKL